jgi:hypothetical protein
MTSSAGRFPTGAPPPYADAKAGVVVLTGQVTDRREARERLNGSSWHDYPGRWLVTFGGAPSTRLDSSTIFRQPQGGNAC